MLKIILLSLLSIQSVIGPPVDECPKYPKMIDSSVDGGKFKCKGKTGVAGRTGVEHQGTIVYGCKTQAKCRCYIGAGSHPVTVTPHTEGRVWRENAGAGWTYCTYNKDCDKETTKTFRSSCPPDQPGGDGLITYTDGSTSTVFHTAHRQLYNAYKYAEDYDGNEIAEQERESLVSSPVNQYYSFKSNDKGSEDYNNSGVTDTNTLFMVIVVLLVVIIACFACIFTGIAGIFIGRSLNKSNDKVPGYRKMDQIDHSI